jgi:hypothetical protein
MARTRWIHTLAMLTLVITTGEARAQGTTTVIEWNRILLTTLSTPGATSPTVFFTHPLAMVQVAVFEALNSIDRRYTPYLGYVNAAPGASPDAAVAQAAHDVLSALFPTQRDTYAAALAADLARLPADAAEAGRAVGAAAARALLAHRANDGWNRTPPPYLLPGLAGFWRPAPPQNAAATFTHYPDVTPFVIGSARQFLVEPPPALTSTRYATDFNEVKALGSATSTTRTPDQTLVARLFAAIGTTTSIPAIWNNLTRDFARSQNLNALETARLFALVNIVFHDTLFSSFSGKFLYGLWRPVTAIRNADADGNPATEADPDWTALIPNPPYPTYPGNYACLASGMTRVLERVFGRDDIPFSITWTEANGPGWVRSYNGLRQLADEAARSRIYGGIHFTFDTTSSVGVCIPLADYVVDNTLRKLDEQ